MCLGFKIDISANIYKLPGRILTYASLVDQIVSNFKERIPLKFKISFSSNDDSDYINISCEQDFQQLLSYATDKNMKNIKLKVSEQFEDENILKDLDESTINWCELIDRFDIEDIQQKQQSQSISCLDKTANNVNGFFNTVDQYVFESDNDLEDKLDQLDFSKEETDSDDSISKNIQNKNEEQFIQEEPENQKIEKIINLDESAIIFIRSENYSPIYFEQEQSTEIIHGKQQQAINGNNNPNESHLSQKSGNCSEDETKRSNQTLGCSKQNDLLKSNNQIKFFNQSNQDQLEQTKNPSLSSSCLNNQMTNSNNDYSQQQNVYSSRGQNCQNFPIVPPIPLIQNSLPPFPFQFKCQTSSHIMFPLSTYHNINPQNTTTAKQNNIQIPSQYPQQSFTSFTQNQMNTQNYILDGKQIPYQNRQQDFSRRFSKEEEISKSINHNEQNIIEHINGKRKSKTTISPVPYNCNLTSSIYIDNANQSTVDHSNFSLLNGSSNQTNLGTNSILSRKLIRGGTLIEDDSYFNQSASQDVNDNRMYATYSASRIPASLNPQQQMYSSLKVTQQKLQYPQNEFFLQQGFQNLVKACANSAQKSMTSSTNISTNTNATPILSNSQNEKNQSNQIIGNNLNSNILIQNGQNFTPENFIREKDRQHSYKIQCQQTCQYRAKILISPKKTICVTPGYTFQLLFQFQNNGETQWPQNVTLRCIEGFSEGTCFSIESAQSTSTVTAEANLAAPSQLGTTKNSFRLCYKQEDEQLKYFGPKVTFELNVGMSMEMDNLQENDIMRFNYQNTTPRINKSIQTSQIINFESSMQNYIQQAENSSQIKNQQRVQNTKNLPSQYPPQNDYTNIEVSPTFISPIKNGNPNVFDNQQFENNKINYVKIQTTPDIQFNQITRMNMEQLISQKKANYQQDVLYRRSININ